MKYRIEDTLKDVRVALDENGVCEPLVSISDNDTLLLDDLIRNKTVDAVRMVEVKAPGSMLDEGVDFSENDLVWPSGVDGIGWAYLELPKDFLRLVYFKMSDWHRGVSEVIYPDNPLYSRQKSKYSGVRGNPENPVCAIVTKPPYKVLECYSSNTAGKVSIEVARYLPVPEIDKDGQVSICELLYRPTIYYLAGIVLMALGDTRAENFINLSMNYMK